jgi:hypothetical protein
MIPKLTIALALSAAITGLALAGDPHTSGVKGQPNQSCENPQTMTMPGKSASARGSAFSPTGIAGMNYAGEKAVNSKNPKSVSQYDVACFQQSARVTRQTARASSGHRH